MIACGEVKTADRALGLQRLRLWELLELLGLSWLS